MAKDSKQDKQASEASQSVGEETTARYQPSPEPMTHPETKRVDY
jgi:hypothetical protein